MEAQMKRKVFISYSHDSDHHKSWVKKLADDLEEHIELHVILDQYDLDYSVDINEFMENAVWESDRILIVATERYIQRSDSRNGGVGIETYMTTARHWEETLEKDGNSPIIVIQRISGGGIPRYLKGKLVMDFSADEEYDKRFDELLDSITGNKRAKRPAKTKSVLNKRERQTAFTRAEDILRIVYNKRTPLILGKDGTDFSDGNRIKFEFWETRMPNSQYFLILFNNTIINQTVKRFVEIARERDILPKTLIVLRAERERRNYTKSIFDEMNVSIDIEEFTFGDFVWEYCVDDAWKNECGDVYEEKYFVDQELLENEDGNMQSLGPSADHLLQHIKREDTGAAIVILAPGGSGKTTLCHKLVKKIKTVEKKIPVLIQADDLRKRLSSDVSGILSVTTVYDLYELYVRTLGSNDNAPAVFDKRTFEIGVLCGNLVLIIDGLDEIASLLETSFDLNRFTESLSELNSQLGCSQVIITARDDVFRNMTESRDGMGFFYLQGFDEHTCEEYLKRRIPRSAPERLNTIEMVRRYISEVASQDQGGRILPFYVDLLCKMVEDAQEEGKPFNFDVSLEGKPYRSGNGYFDSFVYSVMRREMARQSLDISIEEVVDLFEEIAAEFGQIFPREALEEKIWVYYDAKATVVIEKVFRNPLLEIRDKQGTFYMFRYEFLSGYFQTLLLIRAIADKEVHATTIQVMEKQHLGDSKLVKDVAKYFEHHKEDLIRGCTAWIGKCRDQLRIANSDAKSQDRHFRCISAVMHIFRSAACQTNNRARVMDGIKRIIKAERNSQGRDQIHDLVIHGNFPPLDFSDTDIWDSRFIGYTGFLSSKFENSMFHSCVFSGINGSKFDPSLQPCVFERGTCKMGDLEEIFASVKTKGELSRKIAEDCLQKFFDGFLENGKFKNKHVENIKFSNKISKAFLRDLVKRGDMHFDPIGDYYGVAPTHHKNVYDFLINNNIGGFVRSLLNRIIEKNK